MDLEELERRLNTINEEESSKIQKIRDSYQNSKKVIKQLMEEHMVGGPSVLIQPVAEEEEDIDKSMYINRYNTTLYPAFLSYRNRIPAGNTTNELM